jgi:hypothetical protein
MNIKTQMADVHRLLDIVVEEVSLVDRAANKQRFLIVKRSDDMNDTTENTSDATTAKDTGIGNTDAATDSSGSDATQENEQSNSESTKATGEDESTLQQVAVSALSHLTEAVELLGNSEDETTRGRVVELAGELRAVAERLAGTPEATGDSKETTEGGDKDIESLIDSVKAALVRVTTLISGKDDKATEGKLPELIGELKSLTTAVKEQQQRLTKLEKRFGMPSSVPVGEGQGQGQSEPNDVGWPMDMNRSCDRESVDKAVSFHDV